MGYWRFRMVSIADSVRHLVEERLLLGEYLNKGFIHYGNLSEALQSEVEKELGRKIKSTTIAMALRRMEQQKLGSVSIPSLHDSELVMKNGLCNIIVRKNTEILPKLSRIESLVDINSGDTLNIMHANNEIRILINERYEKQVLEILHDEKLLNFERGLVAIVVRFMRDYQHVPGLTYSILKQLAIMNISLIEIVSAFYEVMLVISKKDATKGYQALQSFIESS
ncbi:hypothetical protein HY486_02655 [Candidatus Woesearchaeota archaeon]|nr:hypothetical protein [Candidatus Woesearchaeota archaeon]